MIRRFRAVTVTTALFICLAVLNGRVLSLNWLNDSRIILDDTRFSSVDEVKEHVAGHTARIQAEIEKLPISEAMIRDLKEDVLFINTFLGSKPVRWVDFFLALHRLMPEKIWIRTLVLALSEKAPSFTLHGLAGGHKEVNALWKKLQKTIGFRNVMLIGENLLTEKNGISLVSFTMRFDYSPLVRLELAPSSLRKISGTSQQFKVYGATADGETFLIPRDWPTWILMPEAIGVVKQTGLFFALRPGPGKVIIKSPDGTLEAFCDIMVVD